MRLHTWAVAAAMAVMTFGPNVSNAHAADLPLAPVQKPAVNAFNGKLEGFGGWLDGRAFNYKDTFYGGGVASFSAPLGERLGLQVDGLLGTKLNRFAYAAGAHLFTRDPDSFLFGAYTSAIGLGNTGGLWAGKLGAEAELYLGQFTLSGVVGAERIHNGNSRFRFRNKTSFFDYVDLNYYVTDDFKVSVGHRYTGRDHSAAFGAEYKLPVASADVSVFGDGRFGERHYRRVLGGVKVYFGAGTKSLIARHRESDPPTYLKDDLYAISGRRAPRNPPVPGGPPGGCDGACNPNPQG